VGSRAPIFNGAFDVLRWVLDAPLALLSSIAGWVQEGLNARLHTSSLDAGVVREEVRQRILGSGTADLHFELGVDVPWVGKVRLASFTVSAGNILGALADVSLGDQAFTQTLDSTAARSVERQSVEAQRAVVQQALAGSLDEQQAREAAGDLTPGRPLVVSIQSPPAGTTTVGSTRLGVRIEGANRTFVEPTLGVPRRVSITVNGRDYLYSPLEWAEDSGGITFAAEITPVSPATAPTPPAAPAAATEAELRLPTPFAARLTRDRRMIFSRVLEERLSPELRPFDGSAATRSTATELAQGREAAAGARLPRERPPTKLQPREPLHDEVLDRGGTREAPIADLFDSEDEAARVVIQAEELGGAPLLEQPVALEGFARVRVASTAGVPTTAAAPLEGLRHSAASRRDDGPGGGAPGGGGLPPRPPDPPPPRSRPEDLRRPPVAARLPRRRSRAPRVVRSRLPARARLRCCPDRSASTPSRSRSPTAKISSSPQRPSSSSSPRSRLARTMRP